MTAKVDIHSSEWKANSDSILMVIRDSLAGYSFGKPKRPDEKTLTVLVPILRETKHDRGYVTFPESDKTMVFDTGTVSEIDVENKGDSHVFMRTGTLFKGSTQERTAQRSLFLFKGAKNRINVRCVHATRGTGNAGMHYGGITSTGFMQKSYNAGFTPKSQGEYWGNVMHETAKMQCMMSGEDQATNVDSSSISNSNSIIGSADPIYGSRPLRRSSISRPPGWQSAAGHTSASFVKNDDLASNMAAFEKNYEKLLSEVKLEDNQVGVVLITDGGVQMIESFDHPTSWRALHETAVKAMGTEMLKEDKKSVFEFKPEHAKTLTQEVLSLPFEQNSIYHHPGKGGNPTVTITGLTAKGYVGEVVEVNGEVIHLVIFKQS